MENNQIIKLPSGKELKLSLTSEELFEKRPKLDPEDKKLWIEALLSSKFNQGEMLLCKEVDGKRYHCVFGVYCEIKGIPKEGMKVDGIIIYNYLFKDRQPSAITLPLGFDSVLQSSGTFHNFFLYEKEEAIVNLTSVNDKEYNFPDIAYLIDLLW